MANLLAMHSVGASLVTYLRNAYPEPLRTDHPCSFRLLSSGELTTADEFDTTTLSLFLYRISINEHLRNKRRGGGLGGEEDVPLGLDLHYLLTIWADNALAEHVIMAWAMRELYLHSVLDMSSLVFRGAMGTGRHYSSDSGRTQQ